MWISLFRPPAVMSAVVLLHPQTPSVQRAMRVLLMARWMTRLVAVIRLAGHGHVLRAMPLKVQWPARMTRGRSVVVAFVITLLVHAPSAGGLILVMFATRQRWLGVSSSRV